MNSRSSESSIAKRLEGKVALITGGASGIGECTVRLFVRHGAKVVVADIQDDLGHALCQELGSPDTISYVHCDITSDSDVQNAVDTAVCKYGKLDIMYNNAGVGITETTLLESSNETFKRVLDVNVFGAYLGAKHAARVMIPAKKGCILFTSSLISVITWDGAPHAYVASKHAVVGLTKNLCAELGKYGIRVNCISPFGVATPMMRKWFGNIEQKKLEEIISKAAHLKEAVLEPEDIAEAALYFASDESKYVSGINLAVDGGYSATNPTFLTTIKNLFS